MRYLFFLSYLLIGNGIVKAQNPVVLTSGKISFERKTNAHALMREMGEQGGLPADKVQAYLQSQPQFKTDQFVLYFSPNGSEYSPAEKKADAPSSIDEWFAMVADQNTVVTSFATGVSTVSKSVFGNSFLISDSVRKIKWRWTEELRDIAGFQCRRANGLANDSVYIVAYFTGDLAGSAGPEEFQGLPGTILGVAVPEMHITWFATAVEARSDDQPLPNANIGGKKISRIEFLKRLQDMGSKWGPAGPPIIRKAAL